MSFPENPDPNDRRDAETLAELRGSIESLRGVFQVAALSGIVIAVTVFLFFYTELSLVRRQNAELVSYIDEYNTNVAPKIEMSRTNLEAFSRKDPGIAPILKKYFPTNAPGTNPPASRP